MRKAWVTDKVALQERMETPAQLVADAAESEMPAYMESFLGHLRLLVGVPFDYLIPDARLLPDESIRFFYLDRSWTDRLVDGALAVGKTATREMAHHQAHAPALRQQLDQTERGVRNFQRAKVSFTDWRNQLSAAKEADIVTGFLLRSASVSGWPHMDVRAYDKVLDANFDPEEEKAHQLPTLRLERLSPAVLLALFEGVPEMVICEEPHHGIQFGVHEEDGVLSIFRRDEYGMAIDDDDILVPVRKANSRVLGIAALRRAIMQADAADPQQNIADQDGAAGFAIGLLNRPWRQRFQGSGARPDYVGTGAFVPNIMIAPHITQEELHVLIKGFLG